MSARGILCALAFLYGCSCGAILPGMPADETIPSYPIATRIYDAEDLAFDSRGRLFVSAADGLYVVTGLEAGSGPLLISRAVDLDATFAGLAMGPDGCLYAICYQKMKSKILRIDLSKTPLSYSIYLEGVIRIPNGLRFDDAGFLYAADYGCSLPGTGRIVRIVPDPVQPARAGNVTTVAKGLWAPNSIVMDRDRGRLYFTETLSGKILYLEKNGEAGFEGKPGVLLNVGIAGPRFPILDGMALDAEGNLYVCVYNKNRILVVSPEGTPLRSLTPEGAFHPTALAFGTELAGSERLFITEKGHFFVRDKKRGDRLIMIQDVARPYRLPFVYCDGKVAAEPLEHVPQSPQADTGHLGEEK